MATDLDLQVDESVPAKVDAGRRDHRLRPHLLRHRPQAARGQPGRADRRRGQDAGRRRPLALQPVDPAARRFPGHRRGRAADPLRASRRDAAPDHRQDPLRHLERGDALLSDGHLPPRRRRQAEGRGDRRPPPGARHRRPSPTAPTACPTSSSPRNASTSCASCSTRSKARSKSRCRRPRSASASAARC